MVDFRAPLDGQPWNQVPTERRGITPARKIEEPVYFTGDVGPGRIVHRGNCRSIRGLASPATTGHVLAAVPAS